MSQHELTSYLNLCTQFYDLIRPQPPEDAYAFYRTYVANAGGVALASYSIKDISMLIDAVG